MLKRTLRGLLHAALPPLVLLGVLLGLLGSARADEQPHLWHGVALEGAKRGEYTAVIEIAKGSNQKFEVDHDTGAIKLDRVLKGGFRYPVKYGYFPRTLGGDGDAMDVLVVGGRNRKPGERMNVRIIGKMNMVDSGEPDTKIIAVPAGSQFAHIRDIGDLPAKDKAEIKNFFQSYKVPENKIVKVGRFSAKASAMKDLRSSKVNYAQKFGTSGAKQGH
jgi:inorganic pyrophosphatase